MTRRRSVLALLDSARDVAVAQGVTTAAGWYLCCDPSGGYAAWLYSEIDEPTEVPDTRSIEERCLLSDVEIFNTPEEAAEALLEWATEQRPDLGADVSYRRHAVQAEAAAKPQRIHVPAGPYAIAHVGDPHLDDDGCDWPALRRMVRVVASTPSMYAGNVGDNVNNWVGRLAEQYEHQHITGDEGWRLAEWLFGAVPWVYCLWGNHDLWRRGGTILRLLAERAQVAGPIGAHEIRLEVVSPGVQEPHRVHVRHDFKGSSIWNPVHGNVRASKLDPWADVYVCGHRHEWGTHVEEGPDGKVRWALRARGYKRHDDYARRLGFSEQTHGETVCTVIDPSHRHPYERVRVHLDVEEAAEHLRWLRRRAGLERA